MKVCFPQPQREPINSVAHARSYSTAGRKCAFMVGIWAGCSEDLHNFWVEKLTPSYICENSGLSSLAGKDCAIFWVKLAQQNYTILGPAVCESGLRNFWREGWLPSRFLQILEGVS